MTDLLFLLAIVAFFALASLYVRACKYLIDVDLDDEPVQVLGTVAAADA